VTHHKLLLGGTTILVCNAALAAQGARPAAPHCRNGKDYRTVATRPIRNGKQVIAVDADSRVLLLSLPENGSRSEVESLGYEQPLPADFPYASLLPADEVVTTLRRVSCAEARWKIWVALTVGFSPESRPHGSVPLTQHLIVFRNPAGPDGKPVLLQNSFREILDLTVDDVNGDQFTEIAAQYADSDDGPWMKIWQVDDNGLLRPIPIDNIKKDLTAVPGHVDIGLGDYRHGGDLLFTEQRLQTPKGWHVTRRFYDWDDARQRYQLAEVVQSEEITLK
jgi:hypothetical protein